MGHGFQINIVRCDPRVTAADRGVHQESDRRSGADGCRLEIGRAPGPRRRAETERVIG